MASFHQLCNIACAFPDVTQEAHFEKISFRIKGKIFCTYDPNTTFSTIKLSQLQQEAYANSSPHIEPVPNKWGQQGWTRADTTKIDIGTLKKLLHDAYTLVAAKPVRKK